MNDPFDTVQDFAFRVEALPHYADDSSGASGELAYYKEFGSVPKGHNTDWEDLVRVSRNRGVAVQRLRFVSKPLSLYEEFELRVGYSAGRSAGEDIRVAGDATSFPGIDYWLFDNEQIEIIEYGPNGEYVGSSLRPVNIVDRDMIREHLELFQQGISPEDYLANIMS